MLIDGGGGNTQGVERIQQRGCEVVDRGNDEQGETEADK